LRGAKRLGCDTDLYAAVTTRDTMQGYEAQKERFRTRISAWIQHQAATLPG